MPLSQPDTPGSLMDSDTYFTYTRSVPDHQKKYDDSTGEDTLNTDFVRNYMMYSFSIMTGTYVHQENKTFVGKTSSWASETFPTTIGTAALSGNRPSSFMKEIKSKQEGSL